MSGRGQPDWPWMSIRPFQIARISASKTRSALSIASNIAEGYERDSNNEFIRFLNIAKGSCGELRTQLYIAMEIGYAEKNNGMRLVEDTRAISAMLTNLVKTRRQRF